MDCWLHLLLLGRLEFVMIKDLVKKIILYIASSSYVSTNASECLMLLAISLCGGLCKYCNWLSNELQEGRRNPGSVGLSWPCWFRLLDLSQLPIFQAYTEMVNRSKNLGPWPLKYSLWLSNCLLLNYDTLSSNLSKYQHCIFFFGTVCIFA